VIDGRDSSWSLVLCLRHGPEGVVAKRDRSRCGSANRHDLTTVEPTRAGFGTIRTSAGALGHQRGRRTRVADRRVAAPSRGLQPSTARQGVAWLPIGSPDREHQRSLRCCQVPRTPGTKCGARHGIRLFDHLTQARPADGAQYDLELPRRLVDRFRESGTGTAPRTRAVLLVLPTSDRIVRTREGSIVCRALRAARPRDNPPTKSLRLRARARHRSPPAESQRGDDVLWFALGGRRSRSAAAGEAWMDCPPAGRHRWWPSARAARTDLRYYLAVSTPVLTRRGELMQRGACRALTISDTHRRGLTYAHGRCRSPGCRVLRPTGDGIAYCRYSHSNPKEGSWLRLLDEGVRQFPATFDFPSESFLVVSRLPAEAAL